MDRPFDGSSRVLLVVVFEDRAFLSGNRTVILS